MPTTPTPRTADPDVAVDVVVDEGEAASGWAALGLEALAQEAAAATLARVGLSGPAELSLLASTDAAVSRLNADFRGKPQPTNVLSWPAQELAPAEPGGVPPLPEPDATGELFLGDVALAFETCAREAEMGGKPLAAHATHLVVHAILHLLGYDHICDEDAALMEGLEAEILSSLGLSDPYCGDGADDRV